MSLTSYDVVCALEDRSRYVSERRLTDWRKKGLLPALKHVGRGRASGWAYLWEEHGVVDQASTVYDLLAWRGRVDDIYIPLFLLGYCIPPAIVRRRLQAWITAQQTNHTCGLTESSEIAVWLQDLARITANAASAAPRPDESTTPPTVGEVEAWLNLAFNRYCRPDSTLAETVMRAVHARSPLSCAADVAIDAFRQLLDFVVTHISIPALDDVLSDTSDEEILAAHEAWRALVRFVRVSVDFQDASSQFSPPHTYTFLARFGPLMYLVVLSLLTSQHAGTVNNVVTKMSMISHALSTDVTLRTLLREGKDISSYIWE